MKSFKSVDISCGHSTHRNGSVHLLVVDDGIQQAIFQHPPSFLFIDEHGQVVVLSVEAPLQGHYLSSWWAHLLDVFE
jgi:hypothetical protein